MRREKNTPATRRDEPAEKVREDWLGFLRSVWKDIICSCEKANDDSTLSHSEVTAIIKSISLALHSFVFSGYVEFLQDDESITQDYTAGLSN
jgi:hypothetical protein